MLSEHDLFPGITACLALKYLGFQLGPRSAPLKWLSQIDKFRHRAKEIASSHTASSILVAAYVSRAVPVLGYVAQLEAFPTKLAVVERNVLHNLFKLIPGSMTDRALHATHQLGLAFVPYLKLHCLSIQYRTAIRTIPEAIAVGFDMLRNAFAEHATLSNLSQNSYSTPGWDTEPYVVRLRQLQDNFASTIGSMRGVDSKKVAKRIMACPESISIQSHCIGVLHDAVASHDWAAFLARRFKLTFGIDISVDNFNRVLLYCRKVRPVLTFSFLRWSLNSLPTASRLHDGGHDECPFCGCADVRTSHLALCTPVIDSASRFAADRNAPCRTSVRPPLLSSFVKLSCNADSGTRLATNETDFIHPLPKWQHIMIFMGLHASSSPELELYWQRLFIIQQAFAALRSSSTVLDLSDESDSLTLLGHFHAAHLVLNR